MGDCQNPMRSDPDFTNIESSCLGVSHVCCLWNEQLLLHLRICVGATINTQMTFKQIVHGATRKKIMENLIHWPHTLQTGDIC